MTKGLTLIALDILTRWMAAHMYCGRGGLNRMSSRCSTVTGTVMITRLQRSLRPLRLVNTAPLLLYSILVTGQSSRVLALVDRPTCSTSPDSDLSSTR